MSSKKQQDTSFELVKTAVEQKNIGVNEILSLSKIDYPLFSFRYLREESYTDTKDYKFLSGVITRFHKFSEFGWENIRFSHKHSLGMESIPIDEITSELPSIVTPDVKKSPSATCQWRQQGNDRVTGRENISCVFYCG